MSSSFLNAFFHDVSALAAVSQPCSQNGTQRGSMTQRLQSLGIELPRFELFPNVSEQMGGRNSIGV